MFNVSVGQLALHEDDTQLMFASGRALSRCNLGIAQPLPNSAFGMKPMAAYEPRRVNNSVRMPNQARPGGEEHVVDSRAIRWLLVNRGCDENRGLAFRRSAATALPSGQTANRRTHCPKRVDLLHCPPRGASCHRRPPTVLSAPGRTTMRGIIREQHHEDSAVRRRRREFRRYRNVNRLAFGCYR